MIMLLVVITKKTMKSKWNVDPTKAVTIARLIGELEGVSYILDCLDEPEEYEYIQTMKQKYYKLYFELKKVSNVTKLLD
jgi:hypothetical protein